MSNTSTATMKPGPLTKALPYYTGAAVAEVVALSGALYADDATEYAIDALYLYDDDAWEAHHCAQRYRDETIREPTDEQVYAMGLLIEKLTAICIKHAPEGYTFGERRGALGFWTAEEMDNN